jgi:hypothetical protein
MLIPKFVLQELESNLSPKMKSGAQRVILRNTKSRLIDTIHNHRNNLSQEVIYEISEESSSSTKTTPEKSESSFNHKREESNTSSTSYDTVIPSTYPSISDLTIGKTFVVISKRLSSETTFIFRESKLQESHCPETDGRSQLQQHRHVARGQRSG